MDIASCEYKYALYHDEEKILYTSLILSPHHSHIHPSSFISLKKKHIGGGRKNKKIIIM